MISDLRFLTSRKARNKKNLKCATLWGRGCCKIDFLLLYKAAKKRDNKSNVDE